MGGINNATYQSSQASQLDICHEGLSSQCEGSSYQAKNKLSVGHIVLIIWEV